MMLETSAGFSSEAKWPASSTVIQSASRIASLVRVLSSRFDQSSLE
jgi:hypothetical protein